MNNIDLENRLVKFSASIIHLIKQMKNDLPSKTLANQLIRSGTSVALNYGEAQSAESKRDFIHKMQVVLKELRESFICLKLISSANLNKDQSLVDSLLNENDELIAIFYSCIKTLKST